MLSREGKCDERVYLERDLLDLSGPRIGLSLFLKLCTWMSFLAALIAAWMITAPIIGRIAIMLFPSSSSHMIALVAVSIWHLTFLVFIGALIADYKFWRLRNAPNLSGVLAMLWSRERPLSPGCTRVRWRCVCGRKMYDDFTELRSGAAAELEEWLNDSMRKHAGSDSSNSQQTSILRSAASSIVGFSADEQTAESDISLQSPASQANTLLGSNGNAATALDVYLEKCWLLICGKSKRGPDSLLKQLDLSHTPSDKNLFVEIKKLYSKLRSTWGLRPFLRGVKTIRFVQVSSSLQSYLPGLTDHLVPGPQISSCRYSESS